MFALLCDQQPCTVLSSRLVAIAGHVALMGCVAFTGWVAVTGCESIARSRFVGLPLAIPGMSGSQVQHDAARRHGPQPGGLQHTMGSVD